METDLISVGERGREEEHRDKKNRDARCDRVHEYPRVTLRAGGHRHADPERNRKEQQEENHEDHGDLGPHEPRLSPAGAEVRSRESPAVGHRRYGFWTPSSVVCR